MGKNRFWVGYAGTPRRCLGCKRVVFHGDRCPPCAQELRQRRKRKPR